MKKSEASEQIAVIQYCDMRGYTIFHIPNGGTRNSIEAANLKRQGVRAGVPDLCCPVPKGEYHGLLIEMKYGKNKITLNQEKWLELLNKNGYATAVCYGFDEAKNVIDKYFSNKFNGA